MNIQHFINARKQAGLSQSELAEGICTQTTLSRFENNGQVPSLKILIQLCNRLSLPIGELFPKVGIKQPELSAKMDQAEFYLITSEHEQLAEILASIPVDTIEDQASLFRYYYLQGFVMIFQKASITDILFTFDKLLLMEKQHSNPIFRLLALTGSGMAYSREGDDEKAEFYSGWVERNKGKTRDKRSIKNGQGGQAGKPGSSTAPTSGSGGERKSLFGAKS